MNPQVTITYIAIVILLNLISFLIYSFTPARKFQLLRRPIQYFRGFFLFMAMGFTVFGVGLPSLSPFQAALSNTFFLLAFYCLYFGFKTRKYPETPPLKHSKTFYVNWLFILVVCVGVFAIIWDSHLIRSALITSNCSIIGVFALKYVQKNSGSMDYGEKIAYAGIVVSIACATALVLTLNFTEDLFIYFSLLMTSQASIAMVILGGTQAMFLSDLSHLYYKESITDELTGLNNRRFFLRQAEKLVKSAERHKFPITLVLCDIDKFKQINDVYGHDIGDRALKEFSTILKSCCREDDTVARFGGEEFIFLLPQTSNEGGRALSERAREMTQAHEIVTPKGILRFTASFGVVSIGEHGDVEGHIKHVDSALYRAKSEGRNRVVVH